MAIETSLPDWIGLPFSDQKSRWLAGTVSRIFGKQSNQTIDSVFRGAGTSKVVRSMPGKTAVSLCTSVLPQSLFITLSGLCKDSAENHGCVLWILSKIVTNISSSGGE